MLLQCNAVARLNIRTRKMRGIEQDLGSGWVKVVISGEVHDSLHKILLRDFVCGISLFLLTRWDIGVHLPNIGISHLHFYL